MKNLKVSKAKKIVDVVVGVLAFLKWVPFLGKYRVFIIALGSVFGVFATTLQKCELTDDQQPKPVVTTTVIPTQEPTPIHTPSPSPTPTPEEIILDRVPQAGWPFTVKFTAPFKFNTNLWVDKWRLQSMGHDNRDGYMIAPAIVLNTPGQRRLTVRDLDGNILAEKFIEVSP